jgi:hypothetical protein
MQSSQIHKDKFIENLWCSLYEMAFLDIKRAINGNSKIGAFILSSCFIEYIAGYRYGKLTTGKDYKYFVENYLSQYNKENLYQDLRCKLVHNYSEGGSYVFVDNQPNLHLTLTRCNKIYINLEDFVNEIENSLKRYFNELKANEVIYTLAVKRHVCMGILTVYS